VGFCAESENLLENAKQKLINKNCDIVVANHINNGKIFGSDFTSGYIIDSTKNIEEFQNISKNKLVELLARNLIIPFPLNK
ncbi:MAG: phosphopantothenoylcysteine decarboxylase, partial [Alphaproteobacteria bacterium]